MEQQQVLKDIGSMLGWLKNRESKYRKNFNRYVNNGIRKEDINELYGMPISDSYFVDEGGFIPTLNIIRSVIDTRISKLSQAKPRPFFNPIQGTYKTRKVCRNAQVFFDEYYEKEGIYKKTIEAVRDAEIFEFGAIWVDDEDKRITKLSPWQFYYDPAELHYGKMSRCFILQKQYPLNSLAKEIKSKEVIKDLLAIDPFAKGEYVIYYDLVGKEKHIIVNGKYILKKKIEYSRCPVEVFWYNAPIKGGRSTSTVDNIYTIQTEVDALTERIHLASMLSPANTIFVPKGTGVKPSMVSNEIGQVFEYQPIPGASSSIEVSTPRFIDPQYIQMLEFYMNQAYQIEGISQLSAQAKKPSGLNSGVALDTMEDIESERHNIVLQNYIKFLMEIAKTIIEVFPEDEQVLPKTFSRAYVTWKDIKKSRDEYSIQFSASSTLSKDPKVKLEQIEKLMQMQLINPSIASQLLEFPDLEGAYSIITASYDECQKIIDRAIEKEEYTFYEVVNLEQLYSEVVNTLLRLDANDEDPKVISRLVELMKIVKAQIDENAALMAPPPPPAPAQPVANPNMGMPV